MTLILSEYRELIPNFRWSKIPKERKTFGDAGE